MTTAINNIVREVAPKSIFESAKPALSTAVTYNQGDLIAFNTSSKILKAVSSTGDSANILGVARQTVVSGVVKSPYQGTSVDDSQAIEDFAGPVYGNVVGLFIKAGDAVNIGDKLYLTNTDAQTLTVTDPGDGNHVGVMQSATVASAVAGVRYDVLIGARFQMTGLHL